MKTINISTFWRDLPQLGSEDIRLALPQIARDPVFLMTQIWPLLPRIAPGREPSIAATFGTREDSTCLQIFVWPAGAATAIHDHTSWGVYQVIAGTLFEERYERLDGGDQPNTARLRRAWQRYWQCDDGASTVGPYAAGIHRVVNRSNRPAISLHVYGPRQGAFDGRDYDPSRDYVCDRHEPAEIALTVCA